MSLAGSQLPLERLKGFGTVAGVTRSQLILKSGVERSGMRLARTFASSCFRSALISSASLACMSTKPVTVALHCLETTGLAGCTQLPLHKIWTSNHSRADLKGQPMNLARRQSIYTKVMLRKFEQREAGKSRRCRFGEPTRPDIGLSPFALSELFAGLLSSSFQPPACAAAPRSNSARA